jgi:RNA-directed DNA polymerase
MSKDMGQMPGSPGRVSVAHGEAVRDLACGPPREHQGTGSAKQLLGTDGLMEAALTRQNLQLAWKRVKVLIGFEN